MKSRLTAGLFVLGLAAVSATADVPLRIVSFNTYLGIANSSPDRTASGNLLTSLDLDGAGPNTSLMPDVVCLQETMSLNNLEDFRDDYLPGYQVLKGPTTDGFFSNGFFIRGDLSVLKFNEFSTPGPRPVLRLILGVPGSSEYCTIYNAHFKAGQTTEEADIRRAEANAMANRVSVDIAAGIDVDNNGSKEYFPTHYFFVGDLNQDDFESDVIDALLVGGSNGLPTGLNDLRFESLYGAQFPTYLGNTYSTRYSLNSRYDYILGSDQIYADLDSNADEAVDQDELNDAGFVYISGDDGGVQASGDVDATIVASDHTPVVMDFSIPAVVGDLDGDGDVDLSDLAILLSNYGMPSGANPEDGDLDGDGDVDLSDLATLLANYGAGT